MLFHLSPHSLSQIHTPEPLLVLGNLRNFIYIRDIGRYLEVTWTDSRFTFFQGRCTGNRKSFSCSSPLAAEKWAWSLLCLFCYPTQVLLVFQWALPPLRVLIHSTLDLVTSGDSVFALAGVSANLSGLVTCSLDSVDTTSPKILLFVWAQWFLHWDWKWCSFPFHPLSYSTFGRIM